LFFNITGTMKALWPVQMLSIDKHKTVHWANREN